MFPFIFFTCVSWAGPRSVSEDINHGVATRLSQCGDQYNKTPSLLHQRRLLLILPDFNADLKAPIMAPSEHNSYGQRGRIMEEEEGGRKGRNMDHSTHIRS